MYEFRKASNDFKFQMEEELRAAEDADRRKKEEERMKALATVATAPQIAAPDSSPTTIDAGTSVAATFAADAHKAENPEETLPRIMPPSTGAPVAAARPGTQTVEAGAATEATPISGEAVRVVDGVVVPAEPGPAQAEPSTELYEEQVPTEPVTHND
jgi:sec-independent protein translocase protein TatB